VAVQYDSTVGAANSSTNQPSDAAVVLVKGIERSEDSERGPNEGSGRSSGKALAVTTDCNSRYVYADPYKGAMIAVAEAARNIVCSGGQPLGVTNCLNFGNPYDPGVYYQFVHAVKGMGDACRKFDTPVTGGNVSFYNQHPDGAVYPTPTIGMVGVLESVGDKMTLDFKKEGDLIFLLGVSNDDIASSEYLHKICGVEFSPAPHFDLEEEVRLQQLVADLIRRGLVRSAHDVSEGGLFVTLAESAFPRQLGFDVVAGDANIRKDAYWFGESQGRVVVSVSPDHAADFRQVLGGFPAAELGIVTAAAVEVDGMDWGTVSAWKEKYDNSLEDYLNACTSGLSTVL
jgi:phosphoribosylformylglycinamidine synthase